MNGPSVDGTAILSPPVTIVAPPPHIESFCPLNPGGTKRWTDIMNGVMSDRRLKKRTGPVGALSMKPPAFVR